MRIVFAGTPAPAVVALDRLLTSRHEVVGVLTRPDATAGRGRAVVRSEVGQRADAAGVEVATPRRLSDPDAQDTLRRWSPDCCAVVAYGALVPEPLLPLPSHGWVNLHFSLLPAWRGAAPVQAAIAAGDEITGASTFLIEQGLDTGPVFGSVTERIRPDDTAGGLLARLAETGAVLLESTLDGLEAGTVTGIAQPVDGVSRAPKVTVDDARIGWTLPAHLVDRRIRAVTPDPGAWTDLGGRRVKIGPVSPAEADALPPGAVVAGRRDVLVGTGTAPVRLSTVQPPGKRSMSAADWARGANLTGDEVFA